MKKTANLKRGRKHGSYDVIPVCVRMRKGQSLELWNSTINILRVLLLTQNITFTASWVRRVYSEVVLSPSCRLLCIHHNEFNLVKKCKSSTETFYLLYFILFFVPVSVTALRSEIVCPIEIPLTTFCFGRWQSSQHSVCGCDADNKLEVEHCPFVQPYEQY